MTTNYVNHVAGEQLLVKVSFDGGSTYSAPALINTTRGITYTLATNSDEVVDANNPSAPAKTVRSAKSTDVKIDGAGMMDANSLVAWTQFAANGVALPVKFVETYANATANSLTTTGTFFLTSFQKTGQRAQKATCAITLEQADGTTLTVA